MENASAYKTIENIPSAWPAGLKFSPNQDKYLASVTTSIQIEPLSHVHVIAYDVVPGPTAVTVTLPVLDNLPLNSRIYFFYISQSNPGDTLIFQPVVGSGDTVNGSLVNTTFTFSGSKALIMCLGLNGNYIIHLFGGTSQNVLETIPTIDWFVDESPTAGVAGPANYVVPNFATAYYYQFQPTFIDVVPGIETNFVEIDSIPVAAVPGLLCNVSGVYSFNNNVGGAFTVPTAVGPPTTTVGCYFSDIAEYTGGGGIIGPIAQHSSFSPVLPGASPASSTIQVYVGGTAFLYCTRGNYYVFSSVFDNAPGGGGAITEHEQLGHVTIQYWAPLPAPGPGPAPPAPFAPESLAPIHDQPAVGRRRLTQKSLAAAAAVAQQGANAPAVGTGGIPNFTMADMEAMIQRAVSAQAKPGGASASASSSSSGSHKRKAEDDGGHHEKEFRRIAHQQGIPLPPTQAEQKRSRKH